MPKYGIHYIVLSKALARLSSADDPESQELARIIGNNQFAANLGCIGPDLLFWAPDYGIVEGLRDLVAAYDRIMEVYDVLDEVVETIEETVEEGVDAVLDSLEGVPIIGPVIKEIHEYHDAIEAIQAKFRNLGGSLKDEIAAALFVRVLGLDSAAGSHSNTLARSLFQGIFQSTLQAGREEMDWYWFEMLHYRNTGDFARALIRNAETSGDEAQMAYAYAYVTHVATDVVGHPFVNTISGSPYRMNVQRHVVIENFMDQWKWGDHFEGDSIRNTLFAELGFEDLSDLPDNLANLIADTLKEVYAPVVHPLRYVNVRNTQALAEAVGVNPIRDGFLSAKDIKTAYALQRHMLKFLGGQKRRLKPEEPFPGADTYLSDLMISGSIDIPPAPSVPASGLPSDIDEFFQSLDAWLQAVEAYVNWAIDAATAVFDAVGDALSRALENPTEDLLKLIQALAYEAECMLYNVYRMVHQVLALAGLAYPEPDDAALSNPVAEALVTVRDVNYKGFPILRTPGQPHLDTRSYVSMMTHLDDDEFTYGTVEEPETLASFYRSERTSTPDVFIDGVPLDATLLEAYAAAETPEDTRELQSGNSKHFGNAVDLTLFVLRRRHDDDQRQTAFCNWNLDGDRGYGYKTWDGVPFTVLSGEMDGAIDDNEALTEVVAQDYSVWTRVVEQREQGASNSLYVPEVYVDAKSFDRTLIASLNISEDYVPAMFRRPDRIPATPMNRWLSLVPRRFRIHTATSFNNFFFCNGLTSTPSSAIRCTIALQKVLNGAFADITDDRFNIKLLHNYTSPEWGDLCMLGDLIEVVPDDYLLAVLNSQSIRNGEQIQALSNPTSVATVALLHHGMDEGIPLVLSGHSQGCIIVANALMAFSTLGQAHRDYLAQSVKFLEIEPELLVETRSLLRGMLKATLVYIMNDSDPQGTDLLLEAFAGDVPGMPAQLAGLVIEGSAMTALRSTLARPDIFNVEFYKAVDEIVNRGEADYTALIAYAMNVNMKAHYMPVQFGVITNDITADNFRTDPGTLVDRTVQLSTAQPLNDTSVNVRQFLTTV